MKKYHLSFIVKLIYVKLANDVSFNDYGNLSKYSSYIDNMPIHEYTRIRDQILKSINK